jgi:hypothetical protein
LFVVLVIITQTVPAVVGIRLPVCKLHVFADPVQNVMTLSCTYLQLEVDDVGSVNGMPLLATPPTVTTTFPVMAPAGTGATMLVALQLVGVPGIPLNVIVLNPWLAPKFVPVIVTGVPTTPEFGLRLVMLGEEAVDTVNVTPLLAVPPTVTTTFPVIAPVGTGATMLLALQLVGVARIPLNVIVLVEPWLAPKFIPVIVTGVPTGPEVGFRPVMVGAEVVGTVNSAPLLRVPPTVTTTFPVVAPVGTGATMLVAPQFVGVAAIPLNVIVLVEPWLAPKFVPVIVTCVPTAPEFGLRLVMVGAEVGGTVNCKPLLAVPPTVTTTLPVAAPAGTGAVMLVAPQLVGVAAIPLNLIVLVEPWLAPKFVPVIVTDVPTAPEFGLRLVMVGEEAVVTVNGTPLLAVPPTVTRTFPVVAPVGTGATMLVALQLVGVAAIPLNLIVLEPWLAPKFVPAIVTGVPTGPAVGFRFVMLGVVLPPPPDVACDPPEQPVLNNHKLMHARKRIAFAACRPEIPGKVRKPFMS